VIKPDLILLDEPTSALDRTVQKQVVSLLRRLQEEHGLTYLFISHDLAVVRALAHDLIVVKDGVVVEAGSTEQLFDAPEGQSVPARRQPTPAVKAKPTALYSSHKPTAAHPTKKTRPPLRRTLGAGLLRHLSA
jgi:ABC-type oligopeptide transport system ATPase subunit